MAPKAPDDEPKPREPQFDADPPHPDGFGGSDEESHYMSQSRITRLVGGARTAREDHRLREEIGVDPSEAREMLRVFFERYPEMRRYIREAFVRRKPVVHELKTWTEFFNAVADGRKTFELRKNDRGFCVGDILRLRDFDPTEGVYKGAQLDVVVTYITDGKSLGSLPEGHVCMSIRRLT